MKTSNPDSHFGRTFRQLREAAGLTVEEFCKQYNARFDGRMNKSTVSRYENSLQEPMISTVKKVAIFFSVDPSELLGYSVGTSAASALFSPHLHGDVETEIGSRIKSLREARGLTLEQVGDFIGVNKATVQRYEIGDIDIKRNVAIKLAECLGTSPSYIMGWTDDPLSGVTPAAPAALSPKLQALSDALDQLNEEGQEKLLDYAADLVAGGRYIKTGASGLDQAQA